MFAHNMLAFGFTEKENPACLFGRDYAYVGDRTNTTSIGSNTYVELGSVAVTKTINSMSVCLF